MSISHTVTRAYRDTSGVNVTSVESVSADTEENFDGDIPAQTNDHEITIDFDRSQLKALMLYSDKAVTIETNDGTTPQDTIALVAGQVLLWTLAQDGLANCPFSDDVTSLFVTNQNGAGVTAAFKVRCVKDMTL